MKTLQQKYTINAPAEKVWQALVDPNIIEDWGGGPVRMSSEENFEFQLWDGDIYGKNITVVPEKQLVQEWMTKEWDQPSKVTFTLSNNGNKTTIDLLHEDVPDIDAKEIEEGWKSSYIGPLEEYVEKFL